MNQAAYDAIKATFPWVKHTRVIPGVGGVFQIIDRFGNEVPLDVMCDFLAFVTPRLAVTAAQPQPEQQPA